MMNTRKDEVVSGQRMPVSIRMLSAGLLAIALTLAAVSAMAAQTYKLRIDGLACPFCAYGIEKKLGAVEGVARIEVDIASGTVAVTMDEGATLDEAVAGKAVKEAGFTLRGLERVPEGAGQANDHGAGHLQ